MAKKKTRVNPTIPNPLIGRTLESLEEGECFIYDYELWMLIDNGFCVSLADGLGDTLDDDTVIEPADIEITWTLRRK